MANNPDLDLVLERAVPVPVSHLWRGWTEPETLMKWFCPLPYLTVACDIDLQPGGAFRTVMRSPEGNEWDNTGCYLVVEPEHRLVWTSAIEPGFRPSARNPLPVGDPAAQATPPEFTFTCELTFTHVDGGSTYHARVMHATIADVAAHTTIGFHEGWGAALDQLVALYTSE
jgi:uncharacterized protein YndB with AHSA1/START domain